MIGCLPATGKFEGIAEIAGRVLGDRDFKHEPPHSLLKTPHTQGGRTGLNAQRPGFLFAERSSGDTHGDFID